MAGRCGAGAGWNAGAAGRAIAGAAGRATAAGAAPRLGCCAEAPMLPAIRERPTKEAAKGSAKPTLSGSMVVGSLSYPAPHASITRERGKRSGHECRSFHAAWVINRSLGPGGRSGLPTKADIQRSNGDVLFVPWLPPRTKAVRLFAIGPAGSRLAVVRPALPFGRHPLDRCSPRRQFATADHGRKPPP
jgi:hypothetical protein